ncbi:hypothetical protein ABPG75_006743 [Micractinium tetrahymenae]
MAWPDDALLGGAEGAAAPAPPVEAEPGSVRLQFAGGQRLGGCMAWDRCSGLLAVELQPAPGAAAGGSIRAAILDPQAPESHFVAIVPAASPGEGLAGLAWSPPGCRRLLLTVTTTGRAFAWSMEPPATAAAEAAAAGDEGGGGHVPCINRWYGQLAFELPLQRTGALSEEPSLGFYGEAAAGSSGAASTQQPQRLLCCCFLEPPGAAAAAWDTAVAPPYADRPMPAADVVSFYRQRGLEQAVVPPQPPQSPGAASQQLPLHWLRPGLLCFAAVTSGGQLLLACSGRGVGGAGAAAGDSWVLAPRVQLLGAAGGSQLAHADVAAASGTASLLVAVAMTAAAGGAQQAQLFEVAGPPPPLLGPQGSALQLPPQQQQQQRAARIVLPPSAVPPGATPLSLAFLPGQAAAGSGARVLLTFAGAGGTHATVLTCSSSGGVSGGSVGLHTWQVRAGSAASLHSEHLPAALAAACQDGTAAAVLLPGATRLLCLSCQTGSDGSGGATCAVSQARPAAQLPLAFPAADSATSDAAAQQQQQRAAGLAVSPHGLLAAVAAPGSSGLLLASLVRLPSRAAELEGYMLELGKRCCCALLTATAAAAWWDLCACAAAVARQWGHQHLQVTQQLVDAAVAAARPESRQRLVIMWARLKSCLLSAAAAAHPAAAADCLAAAVQVDAAAKEWLATAADVFDQHLPDSAALKAAMAKGSAALNSESRAALVRMLPARYWAMWAGAFAQYLVRCLHAWVKAKQREQQQGVAWPGAPPPASSQGGPAHHFAAAQNSLADCVPCIRLLSDFQFYRSFGRLVSSVHQLTRVLNHLHRTNSKPNNFTIMLQQLQLLQEAATLLKHLHESYAKAKQAAESSIGSGGEGEAAAAAAGSAGALPGYGGVWTLLYAAPAPALSTGAVVAALNALRQQQGGSALLRGVPAAAEAAPGGKAGEGGQSPRALLAAAVPLGLLPAARASGSGHIALSGLLLQRDVALASAAAGDAAGSVPLPPPAAAPDWAAWAGWAARDDGWAGGSGLSSHGGAAGEPAAGAAAVQRQWEAERSAALGLPPGGSDDPLAYQESRDVLTGRPLSWEYPILYAAADGSCATAELQPEAFTPGSASGWQAAYAAAAPVGGQAWKRLRVA